MSQAKVVSAHIPVHDDPIQLSLGEEVAVHHADSEFEGWYWCRSSAGKEGWVHEHFLSGVDKTATAIKNYSAMEVTVAEGSHVRIRECLGGWAHIIRDDGVIGWVPANSLRPLVESGP